MKSCPVCPKVNGRRRVIIGWPGIQPEYPALGASALPLEPPKRDDSLSIKSVIEKTNTMGKDGYLSS